MHRTPDSCASELRGSLPQAFLHLEGTPAVRTLFDGIETTWDRVHGSRRVRELIAAARRAFNPERPSDILPILLDAHRLMDDLGSDAWITVKRRELVQVILGCAGLRVDANAAVPQAVPGADVRVVVTMVNRSPAACIIRNLAISSGGDTVLARALDENVPVDIGVTMRVPPTAHFSTPYWLDGEKLPGRYAFDDSLLVGLSESPPAASVRVLCELMGRPLSIQVPVRYRWVDPTGGELFRPFLIVPPVSVSLTSSVILYGGVSPQAVTVLVRNTVPQVSGIVRLGLPAGWLSDPQTVAFAFDSTLTERVMRFALRQDGGATDGHVTAVAVVGGKEYDHALVPVAYPHFPPQAFLAPSRARLVGVDIIVPQLRIGYIPGAGDEVPAALARVGCHVELLTDDDLESGELLRYDAIVAGIRAYNTNAKLRAAHDRLMEYIRGGGRYIVQYVTRPRSGAFPIGPFPLRITQDRVSVEEAPVRFLLPDHPLVRFPNRLEERDFDGWVQERGLYFADDASRDYAMPFSCNDPGERPHGGGLMFARYGGGYFVYTGFSFFRQFPAGVPGAYRLFVNLLSQEVQR